MLDEKEFTRRYIAQLSKYFKYSTQIFVGMAPGAYEMWVDDDPENQTPEDMADNEADEIRRSG